MYNDPNAAHLAHAGVLASQGVNPLVIGAAQTAVKAEFDRRTANRGVIGTGTNTNTSVLRSGGGSKQNRRGHYAGDDLTIKGSYNTYNKHYHNSYSGGNKSSYQRTMPYRRTYRRGGFRRRTFRKGRLTPRMKGTYRTGGFYSKRANRVNIERKFLDYQGVNNVAFLQGDASWNGVGMVPATATGTTLCFPTLAQGTGVSERLGQVVNVKSIQFDMDVFPVNEQIKVEDPGDLSDISPPETIRVEVALIFNRQTNGAAGTNSEIFDDPGYVYSDMNLDNRKRFKVIRRWTLNYMPHVQSTTDGTGLTKITWVWDRKTIKMFKKMNVPIIQNGTGASVSTLRSNSFQLYWCVGGGAYTTPTTPVVYNTVQMNFSCRVRYTDA